MFKRTLFIKTFSRFTSWFICTCLLFGLLPGGYDAKATAFFEGGEEIDALWENLDAISIRSGINAAQSNMVINVKEDYDAKADGSLDTVALQAAIDAAGDAATKSNRVEVYFPSGTYITRALTLRSNITLNLAKGAVIKASPDSEHWNEDSGYNRKPLVSGADVKNVHIKGHGTIDCSGGAFYSYDPAKPDTENGHLSTTNRPDMTVYFRDSENIVVEGVTIKDSVRWTVHFDMSDRIFIDGITIRNPELIKAREADGIDINTCQYVIVQNCNIEAADDTVCLKSMDLTNRPASFANARRDMKKILVQDCILATTCNATKIGTETIGNIYDVTFQRIRVRRHSQSNSPVIAAVSFQSNDGADVHDITARDYFVEDVDTPIFISLQNRNRGGHNNTSKVRDITIENFYAEKSYRASQINAADGMSFGDIKLSNVAIHNYEIYRSNEELKHPNAPGTGNEEGKNEGTYPEAALYGRMPAYGLYARNVSLNFEGQMNFYDRVGTGRPMIFKDGTTTISGTYDEDLIAAQNAAAAFNLLDGDIKSVIESISLPTTAEGIDGISWVSSDERVLSTDGVVNRPEFKDGNATVRLTALFRKNSAASAKDFYVRVLCQPDPGTIEPPSENIVYNGNFEGGGNGWTVGVNKFSVTAAVDNLGRNGGRCLRLAGTDTASSLWLEPNTSWLETNAGLTNGRYPVEAYTTYVFSFWYKMQYAGDLLTLDPKKFAAVFIRGLNTNIPNTNVVVMAYNSNESQSKGGPLIPFVPTNEWTKVTCMFNTGNDNYPLWLGVRDTNTIDGLTYYFDDFEIRKVKEAEIFSRSFEEGVTPWTLNLINTDTTIKADSTDAQTGSKSMKLTKGTADTDWRNIDHPYINVRPNTDYKLSFYYKYDLDGALPRNNNMPQINVRPVRNSWAGEQDLLLSSYLAGGDGEWHKFSAVFNSGDVSSINLRLRDSIPAGMVVHFDDFRLEKQEFSITFNNEFGGEMAVWLYTAAYNSTGSLLDLNCEDFVVEEGMNTLIGTLKLPANTKRVSVFAWKKDTMEPLEKASNYYY